jgi:hypothetical protein
VFSVDIKALLYIVTVTDPGERRHSVDVQATSTFDAAHLFVAEAKKERPLARRRRPYSKWSPPERSAK